VLRQVNSCYLIYIPLTVLQLQKADEIIAQLGTGADAVKAAQGLVAAEQNFNPFVVSIPSICSDPTLPKTEILRGIVPLVDPAVGGSALENANQAASLKVPFVATGMSVAQVMAAHGFSNFTTKDLAGNVGQAPPAGSGGAVAPVAASSAQDATASPAEGKIHLSNTYCFYNTNSSRYLHLHWHSYRHHDADTDTNPQSCLWDDDDNRHRN
jgi:hypothetical protein